jgi:hypothetical protein
LSLPDLPNCLDTLQYDIRRMAFGMAVR